MQEALRHEAISMVAPANNRVAQTSGTETARTVTQKFPMQNLSWQQIEDRLTHLGTDRPVITTKRNGEVSSFHVTTLKGGDTEIEIDRRTGEVSITAPEPSLGGWRQTLQFMDRPQTSRDEQLELVRLQQAEPAPIQQALRLMSQLPNRTPSQAAAANQRLQTRGIPTTAVAMQNPAANPNPQANQPPAGAPNPNAQPPAGQQGAPEAQAVVPVEGGSGVLGDVQVEFVPELGVLVVRGSKRDVQRVMEVIKEIEARSDLTRPEVAVFPLVHLNSAAAADLLNDIYDDAFAPRQGQVSITSLDSPNALLLIGRKEAVAAVQELIKA